MKPQPMASAVPMALFLGTGDPCSQNTPTITPAAPQFVVHIQERTKSLMDKETILRKLVIVGREGPSAFTVFGAAENRKKTG